MSKLFGAMNASVTTTTNGMSAYQSTMNSAVDLFFKIGASRGRFKELIPIISRAAAEDLNVALRILLWSRDVRAGAGERRHIRDAIKLLYQLGHLNADLASRLIPKIVELGRWDDLLAFIDTPGEHLALDHIWLEGLGKENGLCAKWMPREKNDPVVARKIMKHHGKCSPRQYRKMLSRLSATVEDQMCAKEWGAINYSHVPSVASARYQKAFGRNDTERYVGYLESLKKGEKGVKINAGAVYPYDITKSLSRGNAGVANEQWKALPDYLNGDKSNTLVVADVSGSMTCPAGNNKTVQCIDVCISLALYLSERNHGIFKDSFITFSNKPELQVLRGDLMNRVQQLRQAAWQMNTNLEAVFRLILDSAQKNRLAQEDMPSNIIILSDMQFDQCVGTGTERLHGSYAYDRLQTRANPKAIEMIREEYKKAGYVPPVVIFWNLNNRDNVPITMNDCGVALVSGFSPSIMKSVLGAKLDEITPEGMMHKVIDDKRYDF